MIRDSLATVPAPPLRTRQEQATSAPLPTGSDETVQAQASEMPRVHRAPYVPDMAILSAGNANRHLRARGFNVSSDTLQELLTRINVSGAGVATRSGGGSRVQIASLGRAAAVQDPALVARLRVIEGALKVEREAAAYIESQVEPSAEVAPPPGVDSPPAVEVQQPVESAREIEGPPVDPAPAAGAAPSGLPLSAPVIQEPTMAPRGSLVDVFG